MEFPAQVMWFHTSVLYSRANHFLEHPSHPSFITKNRCHGLQEAPRVALGFAQSCEDPSLYLIQRPTPYMLFNIITSSSSSVTGLCACHQCISRAHIFVERPHRDDPIITVEQKAAVVLVLSI